MFFLMDQPDQPEFEDLSSRYKKMDISSTQALVKLLRVGSDLLAGFEKLLGIYHLSQGKFLILVVMNRNPKKAITPSQLAEKIGVTRATMTGLIKGLEKDGLISSTMDNVDRRKLFLKLTSKGIKTLESILPDYYAKIAKVMGFLDANEKKNLTTLLEKVAAGLPFLTQDPAKSDIPVNIIPFSKEYQDQVVQLITGIQQNEFHIPITAKDQPDLLDIDSFYQKGCGNFWIALQGDHVIGTISLKDIGTHAVALRKMFVDKDFRGRSFRTGKLLLDTAIRWSKKNDISA
ncbi:MAG: GNAT family N-acetyltransferase, partial [Proteobacteria bacterium]|nr:GNAT family N-acetyltransferase [Pseudomonadota bacterium]MBU1585675.1 GNAT family N-acetyltransferase [Pseudomonadota bacterium]